MPARLAADTGRDAAAVLRQRFERETGVEPRKAASVAKLATGRFCCYRNTVEMAVGVFGEKRYSLNEMHFFKPRDHGRNIHDRSAVENTKATVLRSVA